MQPTQVLDLQAKQYRILSVDGGGIYGLVSTLWLKRLFEGDALFLRRPSQDTPGAHEHQYIFAGASAGAVTMLLLAKYENPRDGVEEAVDFWKARIGAFSNVMDPAAAWLSLFNLGGWLGEADFRSLLQRHFGKMTLGQLKHPVVITAFDWTGDSPGQHRPQTPLDPYSFLSALHPFMGLSGRDTSSAHKWRPRIFTNLYDRNCALSAEDVAYWAATPPGIRAIRDGLGDAATFGANPSVDALAFTLYALSTAAAHRDLEPLPNIDNKTLFLDSLRELTRQVEQLDTNAPMNVLRQRMAPRTLDTLLEFLKSLSEEREAAASYLDRISLLSVGNGSTQSSYWLKDFNFSPLQMAVFPTNPYHGNFWPPSVNVVLDAPIAEASSISTMLLGKYQPSGKDWDTRYYRLNPSIMSAPVLVSTMLARFDAWRELIVGEISNAVDSRDSREAVGVALEFMRRGWRMTVPVQPGELLRGGA